MKNCIRPNYGLYQPQDRNRSIRLEKLFLVSYSSLVGQIVNHSRLKIDYPDIDFIGIVGFDRTRQELVVLQEESPEIDKIINTELSEREQEVLKLVALGYSNAQIARQLFISQNTVKVHMRHIFDKLKTQSRTEAAMYAVWRGWVSTIDP